MPDDEWIIAREHIADDAPDGTKLPRSLNDDGSRRIKNGRVISMTYDTRRSFIMLHGKRHRLGKKIGGGANSKVKKLRSEQSSASMAAQSSTSEAPSLGFDVVKISPNPFAPLEVSINSAFKHTANAITRTDKRKHYLPMRYLGRSVFELLQNNELSFDIRREIAIESCIALMFLHHGHPLLWEIPLAHMDIKLENMTIHNGRLYLIDYGAAIKQPTRVQTCSFGTPAYSPPINTEMTGEEYDMVSQRRILFLSPAMLSAEGIISTINLNALFNYKEIEGTSIEKWLDTSVATCPNVAAFKNRHISALTLSGMLIAWSYDFKVDIDTLPDNPWRCFLLIDLYRKQQSISMAEKQHILDNPESALREALAGHSSADTDLPTLKTLYLLLRLGISLTEEVKSQCVALQTIANLPGFLPHLRTLAEPNFAKLQPYLVRPENAALSARVRTILDAVPTAEPEFLQQRLHSAVFGKEKEQEITALHENALYINFKEKLQINPHEITHNEELATLLVRLNVAYSASKYAVIARYPDIVKHIISNPISINFIDKLCTTLQVNDAAIIEEHLEAWNSLIAREFTIGDLELTKPLLQIIRTCDVPEFNKKQYHYYVKQLLYHTPPKIRTELADILKYLRARSPGILHQYVREICSSADSRSGIEFFYCAHYLKIANASDTQVREVFQILKNAPNVHALSLYRILLRNGVLDAQWIELMNHLSHIKSSNIGLCLIHAFKLGIKDFHLHRAFLQNPARCKQFVALFSTLETLTASAPQQYQQPLNALLETIHTHLCTINDNPDMAVSMSLLYVFQEITAFCANIPKEDRPNHPQFGPAVDSMETTIRKLQQSFQQTSGRFFDAKRDRDDDGNPPPEKRPRPQSR